MNYEKKILTLAEFESYVNSKKNCCFCYSYENHITDNIPDLHIIACFDTLIVGHLTHTILLSHNHEIGTNFFKNRLSIHDVTQIQIENCGIGEAITITTHPCGEPEKKYIIMFDYDWQNNNTSYINIFFF